MLLHQQHAHPVAVGGRPHRLQEPVRDQWRQAERQLVGEEEPRFAAERPGERAPTSGPTSTRATFGVPEIDVGPLLGAVQRMVGPHHMRHAFFTGRRIPAAEMMALGAISLVVPDGDLDAAVAEIASEIVHRSPAAVRLAKEALNRVEHLPLREAYRTEQDYTNRLRGVDDCREARPRGPSGARRTSPGQ